MAITEGPWSSSNPAAAGRLLIKLDAPLLEALANRDLEAASTLYPNKIPAYLTGERYCRVWDRRRTQIKVDPEDAAWVTRLVVKEETGEVVGAAGFHGKPDEVGMVEFGYGIDPVHRRQGHARAALLILMEAAATDPRVKVLRATIAPDNLSSRSLVDQYGFVEVGEQMDEEDGLEVILERPVK
jgi:ribosomal-protein-alanine N-acetyltransferase